MNDPATIDALLEDLPSVSTTREVADLLRVEPQTVLKWADEEDGLRSITFGMKARRVRRFRKADLRDYLLRDGD